MSAPSTDYAAADRFDEYGRPVSGSGEHHSGQVRMAYRLAASHVDRLLYVHGLGWHWFDGTRWTQDDSGHAGRAVLEVLAAALARETTGSTTERLTGYGHLAAVLEVAAWRDAVILAAVTSDAAAIARIQPRFILTLPGTGRWCRRTSRSPASARRRG